MLVQKIQIIEDDQFIRLIAQTALARTWTVVCSDGGKSGLVAAESENPDVILLDVRMPEMDGPTTLKNLKTNPLTAAIPVIFLTASIQRNEVETFRKLDVVGIIEKPFDPMTLASTIKKITDSL